MTTAAPTRRGIIVFLFGAVLFSLSYAQAPLYYSNQQQYFLHGLARAGVGHLDEDWLANTADPTPVFSAVVRFTAERLHEWFFYGYYAALHGIYLLSLWGIYRATSGPRVTPWREAIFLVAMVVLHSAAVRVASMQLFDTDFPWYLQSGLAGQYLLGPVFQPSAFGVFLVTSLWAFALDRRFAAVTLAALSGVLHFTYLLAGGLIVLAYLAVWVYRGDVTGSLLRGVWALLAVSPVVWYVWSTFGGDPSETMAESREILVHYRIPHHAVPKQWFDLVAGIQVVWMLLGVALLRGNRLFPVAVMLTVVAAALTGVQIVADSDFLALLFPWRLTAILIPVATAVIVARLVSIGAKPPAGVPGIGPWIFAGTVSLVFAALGVAVILVPLGFHAPEAELPVLYHVRDHKESGDLYLIPVQPWKPGDPFSGSKKGDFKPAPEEDKGLIPIDLQRFRLTTGAPIYIDFKSIPYKDAEVVEWRERLLANERFYESLAAGEYGEALPELRQRGVTHIVTRADLPLEHPQLEREYADDVYHVYELVPPPE